MRLRALEWLGCPVCHGGLNVGDGVGAGAGEEVESGKLLCAGCDARYDIVDGVPILLRADVAASLRDDAADRADDPVVDTSTHFGWGWTYGELRAVERWHRETIEERIGRSVVEGRLGVEVGCGDGRDTFLIARERPEVDLISIDLSPGVFVARRRTRELPNVHVVRASALDLPMRSRVCSFAYSYGVLHHTPDPYRGFCEIVRVLRPGARLSLYLYEKHEENLAQFWALRAVTAFRSVTTRLPPAALAGACKAMGPLVWTTFVAPTVLAERALGRPLGERLPFRIDKGPFRLWTDLYDRFGARIEFRFSRAEIEAWLRDACELDFQIVHPARIAGWICHGRTRQPLGA